MADRLSTKLSIPHPTEANCNLVGILEQLAPQEPTQGRKIALILHGTMGHKDYLFQKRLATRLPMDSFRFDFRGNFESGGSWQQGALEGDVEDIQVIVDYLKNYGYQVDLLVGHSRGSIAGFRWVSTSVDGRQVSAYVNASGRYRMHKFMELPVTSQWLKEIEKNGTAKWTITVARRPMTVNVTSKDLEDFVTFDTSLVWNHFPQQTHVLSLHGLSDQTVPVYDSVIYANALGNRSPGTHTLHLMEDADHNFTGRQDDVVEVILDWWTKYTNGQLKTGVSIPANVKGKL